MTDREDAIKAITEKTGKTREQAESVLDLLGSAFRRRGWAEGEPLSQDQISERFDTFIGRRVQWNTTGDTWLAGTVLEESERNARIRLDDTRQELTVEKRHLRARPDGEEPIND